MEKRTVGTFIAALRKANGMTQKELADLLNVSDKAVSRWERNESLPDLTLIPVIAEVFGVTCDELLKGQKAYSPPVSAENPPSRTSKGLALLLKQTMTAHRIRSILSLGIAIVGLIAALICNFAFLRGQLGFFIGAIFFTAAVLTQAIFTILAFQALDSDDFEKSATDSVKYQIYCTAKHTFTTIILMLCAVIPFLLSGDAYWGITLKSWLVYGILFTAAGVIACFIVSQILTICLFKRGFLTGDVKICQLSMLRLKCSGILAAVIAVLLLIQSLLNILIPDTMFMEGVQFDSWDSFKIFMETPISDDIGYSQGHIFSEVIVMPPSYATQTETLPVASVPVDGETYEFDSQGNPISEDARFTEEIIAPDGSILCRYQQRNNSVCQITYSFAHSSDGLPVTVYTNSDIGHARQIINCINYAYALLYPAALIAVIYQYRKRKPKITA